MDLPPVDTAKRAFLSARWVNLALVTYAIDPNHLIPLLPPGCELDLRDRQAFVSLVAFDFLDTRVMGIAWPGYRHFPEINLRFYVRHLGNRGVCFIREFVPRHLVAVLARLFYNEPYHGAAMTSQTIADERSISIEHQLLWKGRRNILKITGSKPAMMPDENSIEHFFKEHSWGFGTSRRGRLVVYNVWHPQWEIWPVKTFALDWDWESVYGSSWAFLQRAQPYSVVFAVGSQVRVYPKSATTSAAQ